MSLLSPYHEARPDPQNTCRAESGINISSDYLGIPFIEKRNKKDTPFFTIRKVSVSFSCVKDSIVVWLRDFNHALIFQKFSRRFAAEGIKDAPAAHNDVRIFRFEDYLL